LTDCRGKWGMQAIHWHSALSALSVCCLPGRHRQKQILSGGSKR